MAKTPQFFTLHFLFLVSVVILQLSAVTSAIGINYDVGVLKGEYRGGGGNPPNSSGEWCVAKQEATITQLQANIDWVCSQGIDCKPISLGGICFDNNNIKTRSTFIMNAYYQSKGNSDSACDFHGSGIVTTTNPSTSTCNVPIGRRGQSSYNMENCSRDHAHSRSRSNSKWCVPKQGTSDTQLQANIDWACKPDRSMYINCTAIYPGGYCSRETLWTKAAFAMSAYYISYGSILMSCEYNYSSIVTTTNPSTWTCFISGQPENSMITF